jgi:hypothetical protein
MEMNGFIKYTRPEQAIGLTMHRRRRRRKTLNSISDSTV